MSTPSPKISLSMLWKAQSTSRMPYLTWAERGDCCTPSSRPGWRQHGRDISNGPVTGSGGFAAGQSQYNLTVDPNGYTRTRLQEAGLTFDSGHAAISLPNCLTRKRSASSPLFRVPQHLKAYRATRWGARSHSFPGYRQRVCDGARQPGGGSGRGQICEWRCHHQNGSADGRRCGYRPCGCFPRRNDWRATGVEPCTFPQRHRLFCDRRSLRILLLPLRAHGDHSGSAKRSR